MNNTVQLYLCGILHSTRSCACRVVPEAYGAFCSTVVGQVFLDSRLSRSWKFNLQSPLCCSLLRTPEGKVLKGGQPGHLGKETETWRKGVREKCIAVYTLTGQFIRNTILILGRAPHSPLSFPLNKAVPLVSA